MNDRTLCACCKAQLKTMLGNYKECFVCRVVGFGVTNVGLVQEEMKMMLQDLRKRSNCNLFDAGLAPREQTNVA